MSDVRAYEPKGRRFETFSYLPDLSPEEVRSQIVWLVKQGWTAAVEHTAPDGLDSDFWHLWKLPMFDVVDVDKILAEVVECRERNPGHAIRLIGYDRFAQSQGSSMVVYRPQTLH